jgi:hypothetical protein
MLCRCNWTLKSFEIETEGTLFWVGAFMLEESIIFLTSSLSYKAQLSSSPFLCKGFFSFKTRNVERKKKRVC